MFAKTSAFLVWGLLAGSVAFWGLTLGGRPLSAPPHAQTVASSAPAATDWTRLFGAVAASPVAATSDTRFVLLGVVAPKASQGRSAPTEGVAVIAAHGNPAKAIRIGQAVDGDLVLLAVGPRSAELGRGGVRSLRLELSTPAPGTAPAPGLPTAAPNRLPVPEPVAPEPNSPPIRVQG